MANSQNMEEGSYMAYLEAATPEGSAPRHPSQCTTSSAFYTPTASSEPEEEERQCSGLVTPTNSNDHEGSGSATESKVVNDKVYTVEDAVNQVGFGLFQILAISLAGMIWMTDAMELMLLSVLSPILTCNWELDHSQEALITSVVFVGLLFGGVLWGILADVIGRKKVMLIVTITILIFGFASAVAPEYYTLLLCRCLAGAGIGGASQGVTFIVEFLPKRLRSVFIILLEMWWGIGSVFAALVALAVIPNIPDPINVSIEYYSHINWRIYVALCTLPMALVLVFFIFVPESARYYIARGQNEKGEKVIARIARMNCKSPPPGRLVSQEEKERLNSLLDSSEQPYKINELSPLLSKSSPQKCLMFGKDVSNSSHLKNKVCKFIFKFGKDLSLLFTGGMWKTTILLFLIWLGCAWLYYGAVLLTVTILESGFDPHCGEINQTVNETICQNLTTDYYIKLVWTTTAEFPGILLTLIIIEIIGRKITIGFEFVGAATFFGVLLICVPEVWLTVFLFGARAFCAGVFQAVYVYTPEVFPTKVRGIGMGIMTSTARIGALITPFVAQSLFPVSDYATLILYCGSAIILAVLALLLPIETKGRSLKDTS